MIDNNEDNILLNNFSREYFRYLVDKYKKDEKRICEIMRLLNEKYQYAMDLDLFLRLKKKGKIGLIKDIQALLNYDSDTITLKNRRNATKEAFQIRMLNSRNILIKVLNLFFYMPTYFLMYIIKYLIKS